MNSDLELPHNRVSLNGALLARDEREPDYVRQITHELRTPLNAIIGLCQCLDRDHEAPLNDRQRESLERIERNAQVLLESVNGLLERMRNPRH